MYIACSYSCWHLWEVLATFSCLPWPTQRSILPNVRGYPRPSLGSTHTHTHTHTHTTHTHTPFQYCYYLVICTLPDYDRHDSKCHTYSAQWQVQNCMLHRCIIPYLGIEVLDKEIVARHCLEMFMRVSSVHFRPLDTHYYEALRQTTMRP